MSELNVYCVNPDRWAYWNIIARGTFNRTYAEIMGLTKSPECVLHKHTAGRGITPEEMEVLAWNVSWLAADNVMKSMQN